MSLYDDYDTAQDKVQGWSSSIKLLQSQLQLKKASVTQPKRDQARKVSLAPVIDLKSKRDEEDGVPIMKHDNIGRLPIISGGVYGSEFDWKVIDEYDPLWPNEYEKVVKELRNNRDKETDRLERERDRDRERPDRDSERRKDRKRKSRFSEPDDSPPRTLSSSVPQISQPAIGSGFAGRWADDEEEERPKPVRPMGGVAIAPPPSLQDSSPDPVPIIPNKPQSNSYGGSVAAKIMARYGFKEGQGLGRMEQGMSSALQVEKTSKRGGRILHEKDIMPPPPPLEVVEKKEPPITEIMKNPSKVVLLKNMVGPGEVDDDLEPEVKDECNTKYGPVVSCIIHEIPHENPEEAVRIFVEFQRIESAIKAVVDLNARFFGGRMVKANFYDPEKFDNLQLMD
ncbi:splicing factor 45 [Anthonomus grandis grandis]|uniref:splicing factor 45 n=1 Tax=Anthonomus grandis grandis TaxID=2921223 RepID=UPI0021669D57|nr:splicing factor 45 [Anthonomus grandis grandis]XP_050307228.1 splicing factor 45 [Anthonomus grandis grandis]